MRRKVEVSGSAFRIETQRESDGFDQSRFPAAILADQERDLGVELQKIQFPYGGNRKRVVSEVRNRIAF